MVHSRVFLRLHGWHAAPVVLTPEVGRQAQVVFISRVKQYALAGVSLG